MTAVAAEQLEARTRTRNYKGAAETVLALASLQVRTVRWKFLRRLRPYPVTTRAHTCSTPIHMYVMLTVLALVSLQEHFEQFAQVSSVQKLMNKVKSLRSDLAKQVSTALRRAVTGNLRLFSCACLSITSLKLKSPLSLLQT